MTQYVGYFLERAALFNKAACQSMTEYMRPGMRYVDAAVGFINYVADLT
jgi:hypothetical protein